MNKATFKTIEELKKNPLYLKLKKDKIVKNIELFKKNHEEPTTPSEKRAFKSEIKLIEKETELFFEKEIEKYIENEINALHSIYLHRCLTYKQIYKMFFLKYFNNISDFELNIITNWIKLGIVKKVYFKHNNYVLFLTTRGVEILISEFNFDSNILDDKKRVIKRGYFRANELEMHPRLINHQIHLNQFVLDFKRISKNIDKQYNSDIFSQIEYFDEKHMSKYSSIRPDGLISILNTDFFLEMDMCSENKKQLLEKWENYRNFLSTRDSSKTYNNNKIIVLFIIENSKDLDYRISLVKETFCEVLIDKADTTNFELYIGSSKKILQIAFNNILSFIEHKNSAKGILVERLMKEDFLISHGYNVKKYFNNVEYDYYIRKLNKDGSIKKASNTPIEFLINDYRDNPISSLNKIVYHKKNSLIHKSYIEREVSLLTIVNSEEEIFSDLSLLDFNFDAANNIFFINSNDLENIESNIYQIDSLGNVFKFLDYSLGVKYFLYNINIH